MNIKHLFFTALTAVCLSQTAVAVPAYPRPFKVTQADGTELTIVLRGDERGHLAFTVDGYPIVRNEQTGNFEYATVSQSRVAASGIVAAEADRRDAAANAFLQQLDVEAVRTAALAARKTDLGTAPGAKKAPQRVLINNFPHTGDQHSIVLLIQFSDVKFSVVDDAQQFYTNCLNEEGFTSTAGATGSARDFFIDSSNGAFSPTFDVYGPVTVSGTCATYGHDEGTSSYGENAGTLLIEAVKLLDNEIDFSQYDHDQDGYVDNIYFFYAGYGAADSYKSNVIWPHAYSVTDFGLSYTTNDGVQLGSYTCSNEIDGQRPSKPDGIGTFVHEFGHCLGLADHYATNYSGAFAPGEWDTMASGSYNNDSNTPPAYSAFERRELGWIECTELNTKTDTVSTLPALTETNKAYIVTVPDNENEYYILENRQQEGWDTYLPGHGMLVWHVDMDEDVWQANTVNNNAYHQYLDIVEADNIRTEATYSGDPFPGTANVTQFTFKTWDNEELFGFDDVSESNDTIRFLLANVGVDLASPEPIVFTDVQDSTLTATWTKADNASYYVVSVSTDGQTFGDYNKKRVNTNTLTLTGLKPETTYDFSIMAALGNYRSAEGKGSVTTTEIPFEKLYADTLALEEYTTDGFTAHWAPVRDAQSYEVTLNERTLSDTTFTQGSGFTGKTFPDTWQANAYSYTSASAYKGEASPALRLNSADSYLTVAYRDMPIVGLSFWTKAYLGSHGTGSKLIVERYADGEWLKVAEDTCVNTGHALSYEFEKSDSVRIRFDRVGNNSYAAIDDVYAEGYGVVRTPVAAYQGKDVGQTTQYTFTGLRQGAAYGLVVNAVNNGERSVASDELVVDIPITDAINRATDGDASAAEVFDLQGRRIQGDRLLQGVYLVRKDGKTIKQVSTAR